MHVLGIKPAADVPKTGAVMGVADVEENLGSNSAAEAKQGGVRLYAFVDLPVSTLAADGLAREERGRGLWKVGDIFF